MERALLRRKPSVWQHLGRTHYSHQEKAKSIDQLQQPPEAAANNRESQTPAQISTMKTGTSLPGKSRRLPCTDYTKGQRQTDKFDFWHPPDSIHPKAESAEARSRGNLLIWTLHTHRAVFHLVPQQSHVLHVFLSQRYSLSFGTR